MRMNGGLPSAAVHDLAIHPAAHELIIGTHGRSIYIASVKELQQLRDTILNKPLYVFNIAAIKYESGWGKRSFYWDTIAKPQLSLPVFINQAGKVNITLLADSSLALSRKSFDGNKGLNYFLYDIAIDSTKLSDYEKFLNKDKKDGEEKTVVKKADDGNYYLRPGKYKYVVEASGMKTEGTLNIEKP